MMETQHYKHVAENGVLPHNGATRSTYVFGQNDTNKRIIPRKKFAHEKNNCRPIEKSLLYNLRNNLC